MRKLPLLLRPWPHLQADTGLAGSLVMQRLLHHQAPRFPSFQRAWDPGAVPKWSLVPARQIARGLQPDPAQHCLSKRTTVGGGLQCTESGGCKTCTCCVWHAPSQTAICEVADAQLGTTSNSASAKLRIQVLA